MSPKTYNNQLSMSSIIDNFLLINLESRPLCTNDYHPQNIVNDLSKKVNDNNSPYLIKDALHYHQSSTKIELQNRQYLLQIRAMKNNKTIVVCVSEIQGSTFKKISSRAVQLQLMRELSTQQNQFQNQSVFTLQDGHLKMTLKSFFHFSCLSRRKFIDIYNQIIIKNTHHYHQFLTRHFKDSKTNIAEQEKEHQLHEDLSALMMMNTETNFDYSESTSQFSLSQANLKKQKGQLKNIWENIIVEKQFEGNIDSHYCYKHRENSSQWAKENLMHLSDCHQRKYKNSLQIKRLGEKKIDDFVFNMVKAEVKEKSNKPIAEGGSCHIYRAKVMMSFLNSFDYSNFKMQDEKVDKMVAIKSIKEDSLRLLPKLEHEKNIVVKLRGSITYFLPKYYGIQHPQEFNNSLLMEMINGEPLDIFVKLRSSTISFKTKIYLLLNIIYGIRHLIKYEIVHLDLKPINVLVCRQLITKIIDFGQAYHKQVCPKDYCPGFTFPYVAPEIYARYQSKQQNIKIDNLEFSQKQDSFAFGMIIYQLMFSGKLLQHSHMKYRQIYTKKEISTRIFLNAQILQDYGQTLILSSLLALVTRCIDPNPEKRPKFDWIAVLFKIMLNSYKSH